MHKAVAVIPARFDSKRFPGKPLAVLGGKILIQHVYEQASAARLIDNVFVATDDRRVFDAVIGFGGKAIMTSRNHTCGTDRIAEAVKDMDCEIIVNVQGDEPFIRPEMVDETISILMDDPKASISTLVRKIESIEELISPDIVKVVIDNEGYAMYFSRSPIPYYRDEWKTEGGRDFHLPSSVPYYKHIGIYGYRKDVLLRLAETEEGRLERTERLEQLRALAIGLKIKVKETPYDTLGIDTKEDLERAEKWLSLYS
jgi:3-deoxy-manno-octulosonate cytidylyltransferase (CMP-KDO synthetase)